MGWDETLTRSKVRFSLENCLLIQVILQMRLKDFSSYVILWRREKEYSIFVMIKELLRGIIWKAIHRSD